MGTREREEKEREDEQESRRLYLHSILLEGTRDQEAGERAKDEGTNLLLC